MHKIHQKVEGGDGILLRYNQDMKEEDMRLILKFIIDKNEGFHSNKKNASWTPTCQRGDKLKYSCEENIHYISYNIKIHSG